MTEDKESKAFLTPNISISNIAGGPFETDSLDLSKWKFHDVLQSKFIYSNAAMVTHLMNGLILLLIDEDDVWEELGKELYCAQVPDGSSESGASISMHDPGVRDFAALAIFAIQAIAHKRDFELDEDGVKRRFRALIGYSLRWVELQSTPLDIATHFANDILPDVIERIVKVSEDSNVSEGND